jgi:hypothetical protein
VYSGTDYIFSVLLFVKLKRTKDLGTGRIQMERNIIENENFPYIAKFMICLITFISIFYKCKVSALSTLTICLCYGCVCNELLKRAYSLRNLNIANLK